MVYLENTTEQQEVWIARNDGSGYIHTGSSHSYQEGFEDGRDYQKSLLATTAFTENGNYHRNNGWSTVSVNVPQTGSTAKLEEKNVVVSADTTNVSPSIGYDGMSAVTIDASDYAQTNYENGFDDGYIDGYSSGTSEGYDSGYTSGHTDGVNEEKAKLSATTFTANTAVTISDGGYSAITVNVPQTGSSIPLSSITIIENTAITETEKAYSAITVNVPQTGHTDQELEDAYNSGYTSGETHQKSLLSSTAFTENGSYTAENGWSGITVNIDTASTYNSGYTSGHTDGVSEEKAKMSAVTYTANTAVTLSDGSYSAVTVNVPQTGYTQQDLDNAYESGYTSGHTSGVTDGENAIIATFSSMTATTNGQYGSSAHPLSSITVNVPTQYRQYVEYLETDGTEIMFDLDAMLTSLDESVYFDFMPLTGTTYYDAWYTFVDADNLGLRTRFAGYNVNGKYGFKFGSYNNYDNWYDGPNFSGGTKYECVFTSTGATVNGGFYRYLPISIGTPSSIHLNGWDGDGDIRRCPIARYYGFKIMSGDTVVSNFRPCLDGNGVPCFYETVSETYIYASGTGNTPTYGQFLPSDDYVSGYTDGYASGFTDGSIAFLSAITITANTVINVNQGGYSAITVNVPQTGASDDLRYFIEGTYEDWPDTFSIPSGTKYIRPYCFAKYSLNDIIVPNSVTGMGEYAFYKSSIHLFKKANGCVIENIPDYAFADCANLDADDWPIFDDVLTIGYYAFQNCNSSNFTTVSACCVTTIGNYAFKNCTGLTEVMLGGNLTTIKPGVFSGCTSLSKIYMLSATAPSVGYYAFKGIPQTGTFHYKTGSDYSSIQSMAEFSGWTFVGDL